MATLQMGKRSDSAYLPDFHQIHGGITDRRTGSTESTVHRLNCTMVHRSGRLGQSVPVTVGCKATEPGSSFLNSVQSYSMNHTVWTMLISVFLDTVFELDVFKK